MNAFNLWGLGIRGKKFINQTRFKYDIEIIFDNDVELCNKKYENIWVCDFNEYLTEPCINPIVVSPKFDKLEIKKKLENKGIFYGVYDFESYEPFVYQFPFKQFMEIYKGNSVVVYGFSLLGLLLAEQLNQLGIKFSFIVQNSVKDKIPMIIWEKWGISNLVNMDDAMMDCRRCLYLLSIPVESRDFPFFNEGIKVQMYEEIYSSHIYKRPELKKFKNIHAGKRCFIIATGPSLKIEDLDVLKESGEYCFSVNGIFDAFDYTLWRPSVYIAGDPDAVRKYKKNILNTDIENVFVSDWAVGELEAKDTKVNVWHLNKKIINGQLPQFSEDFSAGTYTGYTVVYDGALQLAVYMGFKDIYLLGTDCNYVKDSKDNYFIKADEKDQKYHNENGMICAYEAAKKYADTHGIKIYNATRGGKLEVFERVDFDSLFDKDK